MTHIRARDYELRDIPMRDAKRFINSWHYAMGCSNTAVYAHGMFRLVDGELVGVALWMPPTRVAAESVNRAYWQRVLCLSRLAVRPDVETNGASFLLGRSIRLIRQAGKWKSLVTYADEFMAHSGAIYRATNWVYIGQGKPTPRWEDGRGRQVARKSTVNRTDAQMRALGHVFIGSFRKHKFVMHLS